MPDWKPDEIRLQLEKARSNGWVKFFEDAGEKTGVSVATLFAIASKESGMQNIVTNDGHNYGVMGIDDHDNWKWLQTHDNGMDPESNIEFAANLLHTLLTQYQKDYYKALAAYKVGKKNVDLCIAKGMDPDFYTPGKNYGKDVFARAEVIREIRKFWDD